MSYIFRTIVSGTSHMRCGRRLIPSMTMRYKSAQMQMHKSLKSIDELPGCFDWNDLSSDEQEHRTETYFTDSFDAHEENYQKAIAVNPDAPMYKTSAFGLNVITLLSHDLVKQWQEYELRGKMKRDNSDHIINLFGMLFRMKGKDHSNWRKKAAVGFKPDVVDQYTDFMQSSARNIVLDGVYQESQESGDYVQFYQRAKTFAFQVGTKFTMGPLLSDDDRRHMFPIFQEFVKGISPEAFGDLEYKDPESVASLSIAARDELIEYLTPHFQKAQALIDTGEWENTYGTDGECLLRALLANGGLDYGSNWGMKDQLNLLITFVFAAYDTTASTMANLLYAMDTHPEETKKLRDYIHSDPVLSNPDTRLDLNLLSGCAPLNAFIEEVNRMYNIVPFAFRQVYANDGLDFGGYLIPKDQFILIPIRWLHQGEKSWTDAFEFKPERYNKENGNKQERGDIGRYNSIPFMTGMHKCLGIHLAKHELRMYTVMLLRDWEFEIDREKLKECTNGMSFEGISHYDVWIKLKKLQ